MQEKQFRSPTIHKKEIILDKWELDRILKLRKMQYKELWRRASLKYGLDLTYKGFMSNLSNNTTWKLLYAHAICDILDIHYMEIFSVIDVDVKEKAKEKEEWKQKYQKE